MSACLSVHSRKNHSTDFDEIDEKWKMAYIPERNRSLFPFCKCSPFPDGGSFSDITTCQIGTS